MIAQTASQPTVLLSLLDQLVANVSSILTFYGLTAGFVLTLYALYTKDKDLRVSRRELFHVLVLAMLAFMFQSLVWALVALFGVGGRWPAWISAVAMIFYLWGLVYFFVRVAVLSHLRIEKFKDKSFFSALKHLPGIRRARRKWDTWMEKRYETTSEKRQSLETYSELTSLVPDLKAFPEDRGYSVLLTYTNLGAWLRFAAGLIKNHIDNGDKVTYVCCRHHPNHVLSYAEEAWPGKREELRENLVLVDGFTPTFGGDDEVFHKLLQASKHDGYHIVPAASVAGIHSGCAAAFKHFKRKLKGRRLPATVVYDGLLVYRHCEAEEHVTRFLMHMIEAERTYKMITLIAEPEGETDSAAFGTACALVDSRADLRPETSAHPQNGGQP